MSIEATIGAPISLTTKNRVDEPHSSLKGLHQIMKPLPLRQICPVRLYAFAQADQQGSSDLERGVGLLGKRAREIECFSTGLLRLSDIGVPGPQ